MRKILVVLFGLSLLTVLGMFAYEQRQLRALQESLTASTEAIATQYASLLTEHLFPLKDAYVLTEAQSGALQRAEEAHAHVLASKTLAERVQQINDVQKALQAFVRVSSEAPYREDPSYMALERTLSEQSSVRPSLEAYNSLAIRMNASSHKGSAYLMSRWRGLKREPLPFLYFDGRQEFVPQVGL